MGAFLKYRELLFMKHNAQPHWSLFFFYFWNLFLICVKVKVCWYIWYFGHFIVQFFLHLWENWKICSLIFYTLGTVFKNFFVENLRLKLCFRKIKWAWNLEQNQPLNISDLYLDIADQLNMHIRQADHNMVSQP